VRSATRAGSFCSAPPGPARVTTIGEQKAANPLLAAPDEDAFARRLLASLGLLAYSTISQVGYLLMAVAVATRSSTAPRSLLFYLAAYAVTNLAAFAVVTELPHARTVASYRGLAARHPGLGPSWW
jgi:Proton-conducting membrane transporter